MKATYLSLCTMAVASLWLAGGLFYSAYCRFTHHPIPWLVGPIGAVAALVLVLVGRTIHAPGRD